MVRVSNPGLSALPQRISRHPATLTATGKGTSGFGDPTTELFIIF